MSPFDLIESEAAAVPSRDGLAAAHRAAEQDLMPRLIAEAKMSDRDAAAIRTLAGNLAGVVRSARASAGGVDAPMLEFSLESREGIALMCLAEALLRVPDAATRDRLIRDKVGQGDWRAHLGR